MWNKLEELDGIGRLEKRKWTKWAGEKRNGICRVEDGVKEDMAEEDGTRELKRGADRVVRKG